MLALGVFFLSVGETLLYLVLGRWLWQDLHWSLPTILLLFLGLALGLRIAITAYLFAVTELFRSPRPPQARLDVAAALGLFLRELLAVSSLYTMVHALDRWLGLRDPKLRPLDDRPPVLLLHGFFCNSSFWWILRRDLFRASYDNVFTQTLEPVFGDIEKLADRLAERIEVICAATQAPQLIIVGHSMGGLAARAYLRRYGAARVLKLVTLGTPHHGTVHANPIGWLGRNLRQMSRGSAWLRQLNNAPLPLPVTNIYSYHDNIVAPQDSATLPGARNIALSGIGHLEMAIAPAVRKLVLQEIRAAGETGVPLPQPATQPFSISIASP